MLKLKYKKYQTIELMDKYSKEDLTIILDQLKAMLKCYEVPEGIPGLCWLSDIVANYPTIFIIDFPKVKYPKHNALFSGRPNVDDFVEKHLKYGSKVWITSESGSGCAQVARKEALLYSSFLWKPYAHKPRIMWIQAHIQLIEPELKQMV